MSAADDMDWGRDGPGGLSMDPAVMEAQAAEVRVPVAPYVSQQIGCSDLAPLLVAECVAREQLSDWRAFPPHIVDWLVLASKRAARWSEKPVPEDLRGQVAVWCSERARLVKTPAGRFPEIVAVKAGLREKGARTWAMQAGHDLEAALWDRWVREDDRIATANYALAGVPNDLKATFTAPKLRMADGPLITYPDGWGTTWIGERFVVNAKTTVKDKTEIDPPAWLQIQGEMAVMNASLGVLPHGIGWAADGQMARGYGLDPNPHERRMRVFWIDADRKAQAELVAFAGRAMAWISEVANNKEKAA